MITKCVWLECTFNALMELDYFCIFYVYEFAFEYIKMSKYTHFTIFPDSLSCLQSLHSMNIDHPYILDIMYNYYYISNQGKIVNICWIRVILVYT